VCFLAVIARRGIDPAGDVPDRPPRPVDDISRVDHVFCGRIEAGNRPRGRTWLEADRLSLLSVKSPCPLLKLPELPVEQLVAPLVPRDRAHDDRLLAGELAALQVHLDKRDHDADDDDGETHPGSCVRPCARSPGRVPGEADRAAEH